MGIRIFCVRRGGACGCRSRRSRHPASGGPVLVLAVYDSNVLFIGVSGTVLHGSFGRLLRGCRRACLRECGVAARCAGLPGVGRRGLWGGRLVGQVLGFGAGVIQLRADFVSRGRGSNKVTCGVPAADGYTVQIRYRWQTDDGTDQVAWTGYVSTHPNVSGNSVIVTLQSYVPTSGTFQFAWKLRIGGTISDWIGVEVAASAPVAPQPSATAQPTAQPVSVEVPTGVAAVLAADSLSIDVSWVVPSGVDGVELHIS